ncbi:MAG: hypothetical protein EAZ44_01225 [Cytophagia bacterium]|nr:MAG: hypothetical protein EAZ44_01225 [Cytophagia bacterium]
MILVKIQTTAKEQIINIFLVKNMLIICSFALLCFALQIFIHFLKKNIMKNKVFAVIFALFLGNISTLSAEDCGCSYSAGNSKIVLELECGASKGTRTETDITTGKQIGKATSLHASEIEKLCA